MLSPRRVVRVPSLLNRLALGLALASLLQGCVAGLPRLRPGSNIALPRSVGSQVVEQLLGRCESPAESPATRARDVVECTQARKDTSGTGDPRPIGTPTTP